MTGGEIPGPVFLAAFVFLGIVGIAVLIGSRYLFEAREAPRTRLQDPYEVACLRGGTPEVLRLAVLLLCDRGLLRTHGTRIEQAARDFYPEFDAGIEEKVYRHFSSALPAVSVFDLKPEASEYQIGLVAKKLLPGNADLKRRSGTRYMILIGLASLSFIRIVDSLSHGYTNLLFLILLTAAFAFIIVRYNPRPTPAGQRMLKAMQSLFSALKKRAPMIRAGTGARDLAMTAALFGLSVLPSEFAYAREMFPAATGSSDGGGSSSSGCGSSCGASCGSSDSGGSSCGGCGGGGCGGGCGG